MIRRLLMVGSYPANTTDEAMREVLEIAGPHLVALPDGETGERRNWIASVIESLRAHPDLEVSREGDFSDYQRVLTFRVRRGHRLTGDSLDLGYVAASGESRRVFEQLRGEHKLADLDFQVGVPTGLGIAMFAMGPIGPLLHRRAFTDAIVREITEIRAAMGEDVVVQLELPAELAFVAMTPGPLRRPLAAWLARSVTGLVARTPAGTRIGLHLCMGDLGHKAFVRLRDARPAVLLANAVADRWPASQRLEYVHVPLAAGDEPSPLDAAFYAPLAGLRLPDDTRLAAGFLHEDREAAELTTILRAVDSAAGRPVDVAASCGLGRRPLEAARHIVRAGAELCATEPGTDGSGSSRSQMEPLQ